MNVDSPDKEKVCKWASDIDLPKNNAETVFYRAETMRLFKCQAGQINVLPEITEILNKPSVHLSTVNDYFNAFMINKRAKHYGMSIENPSSTEFFKKLLEVIEKQWINGFSLDSF